MSNNKQSSVMHKNTVIIDAEVMININHDLNDLVNLLEDAIMDLHNAKGGQQLRHSYILYRDRINAIKDELNKSKSNGTNQ